MGNKIVTLGEIMMRLTVCKDKLFSQTDGFTLCFGGAEANVGAFLSNLGEEVKFITKLPNNPLGIRAKKFLEMQGIDTNEIILDGERIGTYYLEQGFGVRESKVIYDRKNSAMAMAKREEFNIEKIFEEAKLFHVSGITPALSKEHIELVKDCIKYCKENNIKISIDLNYRSKLWSFKEFTETMGEIVEGADLVFGWLDKGAENFKSIKFKDEEEEKIFFENKFNMLKEVYGIKGMATTIRETVSSNKNKIKGLFVNESGIVFSKKYEFEILDRIGAGDAFAGGILYGLLNEKSKVEMVEFGTCANVYKHTVLGDSLNIDEETIKKLCENNYLDIVR